MSTPVTYVANQYNIPAYQDTGYAQGSGNLSSYLIALATGNLTLSGGSFPLTADADFGASFGLKSLYYKSRSANPASTGIVRLGNTETIGWRNAAHDGDMTLTVDSSNNLNFSGSITTTTQFLAPTGSASVPGISSLTYPNSGFYPTNANQWNVSLAGTNYYSFTTVGFTGVQSLPQLGLSLSPWGNMFMNGTLTNSATSNQIVLGTTRTVTISAGTPASSSRTWTVPDISGNGTFAALEGTQTFSGAKTFSSTLTMSGATIAMGSQKITGLAAGSTSGDALRYEQLFGVNVTLTGLTVAPSVASDTPTAILTSNFPTAGGMHMYQYKTTGLSTAKQIASIDDYASIVLVSGYDGSSARFSDIVLAGFGSSTPNTVSQLTASGSPGTRTYSMASNTQLKLALSAGTYTVDTICITIGPN